MRGHGVEIVDTLGEGVAQVVHMNCANERLGWTCPGADQRRLKFA